MGRKAISQVNFDELEKILVQLNSKSPNWMSIKTLVEKNGLPFEKSVTKQIDLILEHLNSMRFKKNQNLEL